MNKEKLSQINELNDAIRYIADILHSFNRIDENKWSPAHSIKLKSDTIGCLSDGILISKFETKFKYQNEIVTRLEKAIIKELETIQSEYIEEFEKQ